MRRFGTCSQEFHYSIWRLTLHRSESSTGFKSVLLAGSKVKPYLARLRHGGKMRNLGIFATAEEAALPKRHEEGGATGYEAAHFSARRRRRLGRPSISTGLRTARPTKRGQPRAEAQAAQGAGRRSKFVSAALF